MSTIVTDLLQRPNKGFHPLLEEPIPYLFVDGCMQAWRDADYANAHRHGVTAYGVTAILPRTSEVDIGRTSDSTLERAIDDVMFFHLVAHRFPNTLVATTVADIRRAREENRAACFLCAQDGDWIGRQLHRNEALYRLGLRALRDFNCYPQVMTLVERLLSCGYTELDVQKILGENFLRVFEEVWKQQG